MRSQEKNPERWCGNTQNWALPAEVYFDLERDGLEIKMVLLLIAIITLTITYYARALLD